MFLLLVNLYEFGQFLRILLWISVPMAIIAMLITTWLHYRRRRKTEDGMTLSMEGLDLSAPPEVLIAAMRRMSVVGNLDGEPAPASDAATMPSGAGEPAVAGEPGLAAGEGSEAALETERESIAPEDAIDNMYKGILWMKEKYEQYRDLADQRIEQLKEQVAKIEKKYQDLLVQYQDLVGVQPFATAETAAATAPATTETAPETTTAAGKETDPMDQRTEILLQAKDRQIEALQSQLRIQNQLLLNISYELDKLRLPPQPQA